MVQVEYLHTVFPTKTVYRHDTMCRQMQRPTHISKVQGRMSFCHTAKFQYPSGSWFLIFLELCLSGEGTSSSLAWSPSSLESGLVDPVGPGLTSLYCFEGEVGMPSGWLLARQLTGNTSPAHDTGVGLLLSSPSTVFSHSSCSRLWLMGNRKFQCRVWLGPSLSMGCDIYNVKFR